MPSEAGDGTLDPYHFLGIDMEYFGPSMTPPRSHVTQKNEIFGRKMALKSGIRRMNLFLFK